MQRSFNRKPVGKTYDQTGNRGSERDSLKVAFEDSLSLDDLQEDYQFELCRSNDTGETYISLVHVPYLQNCNVKR